MAFWTKMESLLEENTDSKPNSKRILDKILKLSVVSLVFVAFVLHVKTEIELNELKNMQNLIVNEQLFNLTELMEVVQSIKAIKGEEQCEKDWIAFEENKCFRVSAEKRTQYEAIEFCRSLHMTSTLVSIESAVEQLFLEKIAEELNTISPFVWIGLEMSQYNYSEYKYTKAIWSDQSLVTYTNWDENAHLQSPCVHMSLTRATRGKWSDDLCTKRYPVICQKRQTTKSSLNHELSLLKMTLSDHIETSSALIPVGFIYTQLPNQSSAQDLWPYFHWLDVSEEYSGLFFRVLGSGSADFGETQEANQSIIDSIRTHANKYENRYQESSNVAQLEAGKWAGNKWDSKFGINGIKLFRTLSEVRPKNTAVRIWKRTG